ncbi:Mth938-like domain-containing protein [Zhengella sp. ZM62]|uniref:Mth938-like domain-containing protein n=1 Tax=Zhengella sedimenti TaxID=3390035 RepID=UPI0039759542
MGSGIQMHQAHFPGRAAIDAYGNGGFRFAGMSHRGSLMCLPSGIYGWKPSDAENPTAADLQRIFDEAGEIEILLAGMGPDLKRLRPDLARSLREAGIIADAMSTGAAVRTYNVLVAEDRAVAAFFIAV